MIFNNYATLALGVIFAAIGGDLFVRGVVGLAHRVRVSPGIIGATLAAFATSSPEFSVSVTAAVAGVPLIALGDALGSNVANVALVLGGVLLISSIQTPGNDLPQRDFLVALLAPVVTGVLLLDGVISRGDGIFLLSLFVIWLSAVIVEVRKQRRVAAEIAEGHDRWLVVLALSVIGLILLIIASPLIVRGATGIAVAFGIDGFIIGATVVALGTSAPEIATAVVAKFRGHDEVGLGTILGSNIFNGLFIVAIASLIAPIPASSGEVTIALVFGLLGLLVVYPRRSGLIERRQGILLLLLYCAYLMTMIQSQMA